MNAGDVVLISLPQAGGGPAKLRPALILAMLPGPYQDVLLCGISSQLSVQIPDWDELVEPGEPDFSNSGLHRPSIIRLSYIYSTESPEIVGQIGYVAHDRLERLLTRLSQHLAP